MAPSLPRREPDLFGQCSAQIAADGTQLARYSRDNNRLRDVVTWVPMKCSRELDKIAGL
jgi:hypothetical protein